MNGGNIVVRYFKSVKFSKRVSRTSSFLGTDAKVIKYKMLNIKFMHIK